MEEPMNKLKFRLVEASTEDPDYPLYDVMRGGDGAGWLSVRFCNYPQEILLQFLQPVKLRQINLLINEKKIPSIVEFFSFYPDSSNNIFTNYKSLTFEKVGYIRMNTNSKTNYKAREFRKVFVDVDCLYLKLVLHKNYLNRYNVFNQVGLICLDFFGYSMYWTNIEKNKLGNNNDKSYIKEEDVDDISYEKIRILKLQLEEALKVENYDDAKNIKTIIERIRVIGKKIRELENQKKVYIDNEDYDNAKIMKLEIERLRCSLKFTDKHHAALGMLHNTSIEINKSEENEENKDLKDNNKDQKDGTVHTLLNQNDISAISMDQNQDKSKLNLSANKEAQAKSLEKINEEEFISYDDMIVPTVLKKINNINSCAEILEETQTKGELEDLDPETQATYEALIPYLQIEGLRKLFSKNVLWKEEGFEVLFQGMKEMFKPGNKPTEGGNINTLINLIMKMVYTFLAERQPQTVARSFEIFMHLLKHIKETKAKLNYDFNITDNILEKLKEKLGDVSVKVRSKAVELYCFMLKQEFCDYNNLLIELVEKDLKMQDNKYTLPKSSKLILGKLEVINNALDDFHNAIEEKRTENETFPFGTISNFLVSTINHSKSDVRKLGRVVISKFYKEFGFKKLENLLKKVDEREVSKLVPEIPEIEEMLKEKNSTSILNFNSVSSPKREGRSKSKEKSKMERRKSLDKSISPPPTEKCIYCQKVIEKDKLDLKDHWQKDCLMFTNCVKCKMNLEVKGYNNHLLATCQLREELKICKRCKEPVDNKEYEKHLKENKCNPAKNINSSNRCPLCHKDIPPQDKGFFVHLIKEICPKQKRRDRIVLK